MPAPSSRPPRGSAPSDALSSPRPSRTPPLLRSRPRRRPPQSHTFQYFEDLLPYESFSVRLSLADIPRIREILKSITDEQ